jgi:hypothetical protein
MLVCQLYDGETANSTLIGTEYISTQEQYDSLPDREKPNWHYHEEEFRPDRADAMMPDLSSEQAEEVMEDLSTTWGKVIITWNPNDDMPSVHPQVQQVDHPFMVNATIDENTSDDEEGSSLNTLQIPPFSFVFFLSLGLIRILILTNMLLYARKIYRQQEHMHYFL